MQFAVPACYQYCREYDPQQLCSYCMESPANAVLAGSGIDGVAGRMLTHTSIDHL